MGADHGLVRLDRYELNSTSTSRTGTGAYTWNIGTDFSSANWVLQALPSSTSITILQVQIQSQAAGSVTLTVVDDGGTARDPDTLDLVAYGDQ